MNGVSVVPKPDVGPVFKYSVRKEWEHSDRAMQVLFTFKPTDAQLKLMYEIFKVFD